MSINVYVYNPHACTGLIGKTMLSLLIRKKFTYKYKFVISLLKNKKYKSFILSDGLQSSLPINFFSLNSFFARVINYIELYIWCIVNNVSISKVRLRLNFNNANFERNILLAFSGPFTNNDLIRMSYLKLFRGKKLLHSTHYFSNTSKLSESVKACGIHNVIGEADLKYNRYFMKYFSFIEKVYILPFILSPRFQKLTDFNSRKNKCLIVGTLHHISHNHNTRDYINYFHTNTYHTMRDIIYDEIYRKNNMYKKYIDPPVKVFPFKSYTFKHRFKLLNKVHNILTYFSKDPHEKYFNFDIVQKFNEHKMFIAPEENVGLPSINFIEGIACGCAYFGINHRMYTDLGMRDRVHYIAYDGTIKDLKRKVSYYQKHPKELEKIANKGYEFVRKNFNEEVVIKTFWKDLERYVKSGILKSSFVKSE